MKLFSTFILILLIIIEVKSNVEIIKGITSILTAVSQPNIKIDWKTLNIQFWCYAPENIKCTKFCVIPEEGNRFIIIPYYEKKCNDYHTISAIEFDYPNTRIAKPIYKISINAIWLMHGLYYDEHGENFTYGIKYFQLPTEGMQDPYTISQETNSDYVTIEEGVKVKNSVLIKAPTENYSSLVNEAKEQRMYLLTHLPHRAIIEAWSQVGVEFKPANVFLWKETHEALLEVDNLLKRTALRFGLDKVTFEISAGRSTSFNGKNYNTSTVDGHEVFPYIFKYVKMTFDDGSKNIKKGEVEGTSAKIDDNKKKDLQSMLFVIENPMFPKDLLKMPEPCWSMCHEYLFPVDSGLLHCCDIEDMNGYDFTYKDNVFRFPTRINYPRIALVLSEDNKSLELIWGKSTQQNGRTKHYFCSPVRKSLEEFIPIQENEFTIESNLNQKGERKMYCKWQTYITEKKLSDTSSCYGISVSIKLEILDKDTYKIVDPRGLKSKSTSSMPGMNFKKSSNPLNLFLSNISTSLLGMSSKRKTAKPTAEPLADESPDGGPTSYTGPKELRDGPLDGVETPAPLNSMIRYVVPKSKGQSEVAEPIFIEFYSHFIDNDRKVFKFELRTRSAALYKEIPKFPEKLEELDPMNSCDMHEISYEQTFGKAAVNKFLSKHTDADKYVDKLWDRGYLQLVRFVSVYDFAFEGYENVRHRCAITVIWKSLRKYWLEIEKTIWKIGAEVGRDIKVYASQSEPLLIKSHGDENLLVKFSLPIIKPFNVEGEKKIEKEENSPEESAAEGKVKVETVMEVENIEEEKDREGYVSIRSLLWKLADTKYGSVVLFLVNNPFEGVKSKDKNPFKKIDLPCGETDCVTVFGFKHLAKDEGSKTHILCCPVEVLAEKYKYQHIVQNVNRTKYKTPEPPIPVRAPSVEGTDSESDVTEIIISQIGSDDDSKGRQLEISESELTQEDT